MIRWVVQASLKLRRLVVIIAAGVIAVGIAMVSDVETDSLREFSPPMVEVQTDALGLSAAEVEQLITVPLEQDLLVGIPFLDEIESVSLPGLSSVVMTFQPGTDVLDARQVVQERLTQAVGIAGLPAVSRPPQMIQPLSSTSRVSMIKLSSDELSPIEMSVLARWVIGPRLLGVPGVANVALWGNRDRQLQVRVDPERLQREGVTLPEIIATAGNALEVSPLSYLEASKPGTGGFIDMPNQRLNIFHEQTITSALELEQVPLAAAPAGEAEGEGSPSPRVGPETLGDVTDVVEDHQPLIGDAICSGGEQCLLMVVEKFPGAATADVADAVDRTIGLLEPGLTDLSMDSSVYQPAAHVTSSFERLGWLLLVGGLLLALLVGVLFWDWRTTVVAIASISVSAAAAVLALVLTGTTIDLLIVAGLVVGLTAVIYDAALDSGNVAERIRQQRTDRLNGNLWQVVVNSSTAMRSSIGYAVLIVVVASLPLFVLQGQSGAFLPSVALAYLFAVGISMLVALTFTPALALLLLPGRGKQESPLVRRLYRGFDKAAPRLLARSGLAVVVVVGLLGAGIASALLLEPRMSPDLKERDLLVKMTAPPGTSLTRMRSLAGESAETLGAVPGVLGVTGHVGRAAMSDRDVDVDSGDLWLHLDPDANYDDTVSAVEAAADDLEGLTAQVSTYSASRVTDVFGGTDHDVVVRVFGENPEVLDSTAEDVRASVGAIKGVATAEVDRGPTQSTTQVEVDLQRAQKHGVKPGDVRRVAASLLGGITVGNLFQEQKVFDVVVWGTPEVRDSQQDIEDLLMDTPDGGHVRLGDVADVRTMDSPSVIRHASVSGYLDVVADVANRDPSDVADEVGAAIAEVEFPMEHHAELLSGYDDRRADFQWFLIAVFGAALGVLLLLQAALHAWRMAGLAWLMLPAALSGGLVAALLTGGTLSLGSVAGLIGVLGLATRAVVVLVRRFHDLERRTDEDSGARVVQQGTRDSLLPLLVTTFGTAALMAPILVLGARPGLEILHPMAAVMLGGLVSTLLVVLVVVPALYLRFGWGAPKEEWDDEVLVRLPAQRTPHVNGKPSTMPTLRVVWAGVRVGVPALLLSSCGGAIEASTYVIEHEPGHFETPSGSDQGQVVITERAAQRLGLETSTIEQRGRRSVVPTTSLFVDPEGHWWVYTNPEPLTFVRERVVVKRQQDGSGLLSKGPAPGTKVVTTGVAELYGVEEAVGH